MCTVSFVPMADKDFILTSNRDEAPGRKTLPPKVYVEDGVKLLYPKDAEAGGSWIGISERRRVISLMNGGFEAHKRKLPYRMSRGLVLKDLLKMEILEESMSHYDYQDIEPFTAVIVDFSSSLKLFTLVWDGDRIHILQEPIIPKIWSSSPLYPMNIRKNRETWFSNFLEKNLEAKADTMMAFHKTAGSEDVENRLVMDRGFVKTKSITQIEKEGSSLCMRYEDLQDGKISNNLFPS